jgi:DNA/RNA endonuclease YhcR with UshA esterase domain
MKRGGGKLNRYISFVYYPLVAIFLIFSFSGRAEAQEPTSLLINEISPSPESGEKEWVELYNAGIVSLDVSLYQLKDGATGAKDISLTETIIEAGEYYLFEINSGWLNNAGDIIYLVEKSNQYIVDRVSYGNWENEAIVDKYPLNPDDNAPMPNAGQSISRIPNGTDTNIDKSDFRIVASSPGSENIMPEYSHDIKINEVVPTPVDGINNEYIELTNCGQEVVDLEGWVLDDIEGGSSPYIILEGVSLAPSRLIIFYNWQTGISLNDLGDSIRLINPNGEIVSEIKYEKSKRGESFSLIGSLWHWTTTLTPALINVLSLNPEDNGDDPSNELIGIREAKNKEVGSTVLIQGYITVLPGVLGKQFFYLQDSGCGIQIYNYWAKFPVLQTGQLVRVLGEIAMNGGEIRVKTVSESDIITIDEIAIQESKSISLYELNSDLVGSVITIQGTVKTTSGATFVVSGSPEITVSIRESTNIHKPKMRKGDKVQISGVLSTYNNQFRILPFNVEGVKILSSGVLPVTGQSNKDSKWNLFQRVQSKLKNSYANLPRRFQVEIPC